MDRNVNPLFVVLLLTCRSAPCGATPIFLQNYCSGLGPVAAAAADLNLDGKPDVIVANSLEDNVSVLIGEGAGTFKPEVKYPTLGTPVAVAVGDANGDRWPDILVLDSSSAAVTLLTGAGDGTLGTPMRVASAGSSGRLIVADFDGDARLDFALTLPEEGQVAVLRGDGQGSFTPLATLSTQDGGEPVGLDVADLNRDGYLDLVVADHSMDAISLFLGSGRGVFRPPQHEFIAGTPASVAVADVTGDARFDIVIADEWNDAAVLLASEGQDSFSSWSYAVGSWPVRAIARDLNGDLLVDILTVNSFDDTISTLEGRGGGSFTSIEEIPVGTTPEDAAVADFNGDGKLDVMVVNFDDDDCDLLLNLTDVDLRDGDANGDGRVTGSDLRSVTSELFDGDGDAVLDVHAGYVALDARVDANEDTRITGADLVAILQRAGPETIGNAPLRAAPP